MKAAIARWQEASVKTLNARGLLPAILPWPAAYPVGLGFAATPCRHAPVLK
jgi:hypothetical protein